MLTPIIPGLVYTVPVTATGDGTIKLEMATGAACAAGHYSGSTCDAGFDTEATTYDDNEITWDQAAPSVTVAPADAQADPASSEPIRFVATFSEPVDGFDAADVVLGGSALPTGARVTGGPTSFTIDATGMSTSGSVTVSIPAAAALDLARNPSTASVGAGDVAVGDDATVQYTTTAAPTPTPSPSPSPSPSPTPTPSPTPPQAAAGQAGKDLAALFPRKLLGKRLTVTVQTGAEVLAGVAPEVRTGIEEALAAGGRTVDDLSVASAPFPGGNLGAFQVAGADAAGLAEPFIRAMFPLDTAVTSTPSTVAGRSVLLVTGPGGKGYFYPSGNVLWVLFVNKARAAEIIAQLP